MTERNAIPRLVESERSREIVIVQSRIAVGLCESCNRDLPVPAIEAVYVAGDFYVEHHRLCVCDCKSALELACGLSLTQCHACHHDQRQRDGTNIRVPEVRSQDPLCG